MQVYQDRPPAYLSQLLPKEYFPGLIRRGTRSAAPQLPGGFMSLFFFFRNLTLFLTQSSALLTAPPTTGWELGGSVQEPPRRLLAGEMGARRVGGVAPSALEG